MQWQKEDEGKKSESPCVYVRIAFGGNLYLKSNKVVYHGQHADIGERERERELCVRRRKT